MAEAPPIVPVGGIEIPDSVIEPAKNAVRGIVLKYTDIGLLVADLLIEVAEKMQDAGLIQDSFAITPYKDAFKELARTVWANTAFVTLAVNEDAAEVITESLSEALSNAAYSGAAGAIDAVLRLRIGGQPPQSFAPSSLSPFQKAVYDALNGILFHWTVLYRLATETESNANDLLSDPVVQQAIDSFKWFTDAKTMWLSLYGEAMRSCFMRMIESVAAVLEGLFARLEDVASEYYAAKVLYDAGQLPQQEWVAIEARTNAELDAIDQEIDAVLEDADIGDITVEPPLGVQALRDMLIGTLSDALRTQFQGFKPYIAQLYSLRTKGRPSLARYAITINGTDYYVSDTEP